jgi:multidrug transporter EmrE-like cation transporter
MKSFLLLLLAIAAELCGTTALKLSEGFTRPIPIVVIAVGYAIAFWLMSIVIKSMPVGVAYAVWSGVGTAGIAVIGTYFFNEKLGAVRIMGIVLIIVGVVILNVFTQEVKQ